MQEIQIWPNEQMVSVQPGIRPGEWDAQNSLLFWDTNGSPYLSQTTRPSGSQQKKKRTCRIEDFAILADDSKIKRKRKEW